MSDNLIKNFIATCQDLADLNLEIGPSGNLSFRSKEDNSLIITPTGSQFQNISHSFFAECKFADNNSQGSVKPSSDVGAHIEIYKARDDIQAIVHTHAHFITVLAMLGQNIPVYSTMHADYFGSEIECVPFANHRQSGYGDVSFFKKGRAFLLGKHGGILLFTHQDSKVIAGEMHAFAEIARLYYDFLVSSSALSISHESIPDEHLDSIHKYYQHEYGDKKSQVTDK